MTSTTFVHPEMGEMTAFRPVFARTGEAGGVFEVRIHTRTPVRTASISRIECLLEEVDDFALASLWQKVFPLHANEWPGRRRVISDLADFAQVLQPHLSSMHAGQLCKQIEAYAAKHRRSQSFLRNMLVSQ
jgi:hypothetical protein